MAIARILILGFVQGVGFRRFVKSNAKRLNLKGWVKNLPDGRVEALVLGERESIEKLLKIIEKGSFFSEVKSVQVSWEEGADSYNSFEILHNS
jgi:acylphosphatase